MKFLTTYFTLPTCSPLFSLTNIISAMLPVILVILFSGQILNILFQPSAIDRLEMKNLIEIWVQTPLLLILSFILLFRTWKYIFKDYILLIMFLFWCLISVGRLFQYLVTIGGFGFLNYITETSYLLIGYYVAFLENPRILYVIFRRTFYLSLIVCTVFIIFMYSTKRIEHAPFLIIQFIRPQDVYSLIHSTEMANIISQVIFVGIAAVQWGKIYNNQKYHHVFILYIILILVGFEFYLMSVASLLLLGIVWFINAYKEKNVFLFLIISITVGLLFIMLPENSILLETLLKFKLDDPVREVTYKKLIDTILENPVVGIGIGKFVEITGYIPHQNILGSWAEGGIACVTIYVGMLLFDLIVSLYLFYKYNMLKNMSPLLFVSVYSLLYLHGKGLIQDTWYKPDMYLWTGVLYGLYSLIQTHDYKNINNCLETSL